MDQKYHIISDIALVLLYKGVELIASNKTNHNMDLYPYQLVDSVNNPIKVSNRIKIDHGIFHISNYSK